MYGVIVAQWQSKNQNQFPTHISLLVERMEPGYMAMNVKVLIENTMYF